MSDPISGPPSLRRKGERFLSLDGLSFEYPASHILLLADLTLRIPPGWTGVVGANGAGKTTLLALATGLLAPTCGTVRAPRPAVLCEQRTDGPPGRLDEFLSAADGDAFALRGRLGVAADWLCRWDTLSHGERKRAQVGTALWLKPAVLAVDEPTNHLDGPAQTVVREALRAFSGIGLRVSHDRDLLDDLCARWPTARLRGCRPPPGFPNALQKGVSYT